MVVTDARSQPGSSDAAALTEELLDAMSALRRNLRRKGGRPPMLSSLTGAQLELLRLVRRNAHISVTHAARELGLAPNTVSTLVGQLTDAGMLVRRVDASDRRVARLDLAPDTRTAVERWLDRRSRVVVNALHRLRETERQSLEVAAPALASLADEVDQEPGS